MKKKILLVGGCGFIGHNLALRLKKKYKIFILDNLKINNLNSKRDSSIINHKLYREILKSRLQILKKNKIQIFYKDAKNYNSYLKIYNIVRPDIIIHLAAVSHANKSNLYPRETFNNSIITLQNSLDVSRQRKNHLIYISSSMVYGEFKKKIVNENTLCKPIGIYGNMKLACEVLVKSYNQVFKIPYTILRPSALYGERCVSRRVGQILIENAIQGKNININGTGNDKLDFTYIEDLTDGIEKCCFNKKALNQTFNLTFGNARKINDLLKILRKNFSTMKIKYKNKEKFMPTRGTLNNTKAKQLINFKPKFSIERGYLKYISWYKDFYYNKLYAKN